MIKQNHILMFWEIRRLYESQIQDLPLIDSYVVCEKGLKLSIQIRIDFLRAGWLCVRDLVSLSDSSLPACCQLHSCIRNSTFPSHTVYYSLLVAWVCVRDFISLSINALFCEKYSSMSSQLSSGT